MQKKYKKSAKKDESSGGGGNGEGNVDAILTGVRFRSNNNSNARLTTAASLNEIFEVNYSTSGGSAICSTLNSANAPRIKDPIFTQSKPPASRQEDDPSSQNHHQRRHHRSRSNANVRNGPTVAFGNNDGSEPLRATESALPFKNVKNTKDYEVEILSLNVQLEEHKKKEMELHRDKEKLNKLVEHYERTNKVLNLCFLLNYCVGFLKSGFVCFFVKELNRKCEEMNKSSALRDLPNREVQNENVNVDHYKLELRKKDEQIL
jgi:hypothetical protein